MFPTVTRRLTAQSASNVYEAFTDWIPAIGLDTVRGAILLRAVALATGSFSVQLAIQTATIRTDAPDGWAPVTGLSGSAAGGGVATLTANANLSVAAQTAGKAWVRFGVQFNGGSSPAAADVTLALSYTACGSMVGSWRGQVATESTTDSYVTITPFVPAILADKLQAALIVSAVSAATGGLRCRIVVRYAAAMTAVPGVWLDTSDVNVAGAVERNTGALTLATAGNLYVQVGLAYSSGTAGSLALADVAATVGVRRT